MDHDKNAKGEHVSTKIIFRQLIKMLVSVVACSKLTGQGGFAATLAPIATASMTTVQTTQKDFNAKPPYPRGTKVSAPGEEQDPKLEELSTGELQIVLGKKDDEEEYGKETKNLQPEKPEHKSDDATVRAEKSKTILHTCLGLHAPGLERVTINL